ncbi:MAG: hypothetical protein OEV80_18390, partial [candidate division Zixibacteria bacterium]|nr:hypothetical protein [candidate division Zixibacteria bacterium]
MSSDGPDATTLSRLWEMDPGVAITDTPDSGTVFSGFTVVDWGAFPESDVVYIDNCASVIISNNVFRENLWGAGSSLEVIACSNGPVIVTRNIFYSNGTYCVGLHEGAQDSWIINNTFDSNKRGFFSVAGGGYAINNIVTNSAYQGIGSNSETDFTLLDYNNVWNNNPNYDIAGLEGEHDIHADPQYWDESVYDYRLRPGSPCVEAGHPDPQYNDPNGSRNDMGALWLVGNYPYPGVPNLGSEDTAHVVNHTPNFFWSYYDTLPQQVAFELEVGTDSEWSTAEMWASGQVYTADTFTAYAGLTLDDGGAYFYRVRVYGGNDWGDWVTRSFRMNSVTASLTPNSPVGGEVMHACDIQLFTENGVDQENDQLYYYFEVYDDPSLTSLVYSADHVRRKTPLSYSGFVSGLGAEQDFWWRVRAFDGFEFCEWSTVEQFSTLPSVGLVNVPTEQATIQAAIELAYHNDTIIVAPGTYTENIDYSRRAIVLLGGGRAEPTTLTPAIVDNPTVRIVGALAPGAELRGFTISGGGGGDHTVRIESSDSTIVRDCVFHDNIPVGGSIRVVVYCRGGTVFVSRNLFYGNGGRGCVGMRDGANESWIINNTMHDNERGFYSIAGGGYAINNIVTNSLEVGVRSTSISDFTMLAYNDIYNNNPNYDIDGVEVPFDIQVDPVYVDAAAHDFGLQSHSPCINAGHPDPQYNDSDGSRNDIGAFQWIACCIGNRGNVDGDSG